jgi:hypothetical protein
MNINIQIEERWKGEQQSVKWLRNTVDDWGSQISSRQRQIFLTCLFGTPLVSAWPPTQEVPVHLCGGSGEMLNTHEVSNG